MKRSLRFLPAGVVLLAGLAITGCADRERPPEVGRLEGRVTVDGAPVQGGSVIAIREDGSAIGRGDIGEDGGYAIAKAPAGPVRVFLELPPLPTELEAKSRAAVAAGEPWADPRAAERVLAEMPADERKRTESVLRVPLQYLVESRSPLQTLVVEGDTSHYDLKLSSKGARPVDPTELP